MLSSAVYRNEILHTELKMLAKYNSVYFVLIWLIFIGLVTYTVCKYVTPILSHLVIIVSFHNPIIVIVCNYIHMQCLPNQAAQILQAVYTYYLYHSHILPIISIPYNICHLHTISKPKLNSVLFIITAEITVNTICTYVTN